MKEIKIIDDHPSKCHDGAFLVLCEAEQISEYGAFGKGVKVLTGFYKYKINNGPVNYPLSFGMFSNITQPMQVIVEKDGKYHFTMFNFGTIQDDMVTELLSNGKVVTGDIMEVYPVYEIRVL